MSSEWNDLANVYARLGAPMRPSPVDVDRVNDLITTADDNVLLLGVTPEYSTVGKMLTAVDGTEQMIRDNWPGDNDRRRAMLADWLNLPFPDETFTAIIGDGSLGSAATGLPDLFQELRRLLAPGGVCAFRTFCSPATPEPLEKIVENITARPNENGLCLRMRMAMTLAARSPDYVFPIREVVEAFDTHCPDRETLAQKTGWTMDEVSRIDSMKNATYGVGFPSRAYLLGLAEKHFQAEFVESKGYPLAERCPVLVLR